MGLAGRAFLIVGAADKLTFDNIPQGWNQGMPDLVIAQIVFQE